MHVVNKVCRIIILPSDRRNISYYTTVPTMIIHSFSILFDERSKASSKTIPPHRAI